MKIFPAIDIKDKKCVRLIKGNFNNKTEYEVSPVEQAEKYKDYGFKNLHIVDLDGALTGETLNLDTIEEIVSNSFDKIETIEKISNSTKNNSLIKQLKELNNLFKAGVLTKEEFEKAKKKILN